MNLLFNYFEDPNEGIISRETERKCGETPFEVGGARKIPMRIHMNDGAMETVECMWVNTWCMLDWIIGFFHKTAELANCLTGECTK